jgi:TRAP-type mannitol/chloroaromatic compound transport system permease large subunit
MTPPFGIVLFVMEGVVPKTVTMEQIIWAAVLYVIFDMLVMTMIQGLARLRPLAPQHD